MVFRSRPQFRSTASLARIAIGAAVLSAIVFASAPLRAAEADDDDDGFDSKIIRQVLKGVGLRDDRDAIEYRERSPLVIPQGRKLPAPEANVSKQDPNWPVEPEVKRAKQAKAAAKATGGRLTGDPTLDDGKALTQTEMTPGATARERAAPKPRPGETYKEWDGKPLQPNQLGTSGTIFGSMFSGGKEEVAPFVGEPPRASLVEPPSGYRTPSPAQPYGVGKDRTQEKAKNYYDTHG
ncbi:MAG: hypothetical protein JO254_00460, partial [Pseudolabrys sp.]|nr:hypothetical protein [Pseudolabrys sp.]